MPPYWRVHHQSLENACLLENKALVLIMCRPSWAISGGLAWLQRMQHQLPCLLRSDGPVQHQWGGRETVQSYSCNYITNYKRDCFFRPKCFPLPSCLQECLLGLTDRSHLYAGDTEVRSLLYFTSFINMVIMRQSWPGSFKSLSLLAGFQYFLLCGLQWLPPHHHTLPHLSLPPAEHAKYQR